MKRAIGLFTVICCIVALLGCAAGTGTTGAGKAAAGTQPVQTAQTGQSAGDVPAAQAPRIVATTVSAVEIMNVLGLDLAGIPTSSKSLPERYAGVAKVGSPMSPDMEIIKSLKPDEVLSVTTLKYDLEPLFKGAGIQATFLDLTSLDKLKDSVSMLGGKYGRTEQANGLIARYDDTIADIKAKTAGKKSPKVLILLGVPGSYLVGTEYSYIGDLVRTAGGVNIVQGEKVEYLASNTEYLQQANPDVILRAAHGMPEEVVKMFDEEFKKNDIWKHFNAVKNGRVYDLPENLFGTTANLAADQALTELVPMLYPELRQ
ncbi:heme ABC transporter substrate-binding protein IsdE [Paenibacillus sp. HW567]|uniref:heme ABC transporter substrate-binding protein IsdE n=1 Tax=Paenibacillus sp. HW567 TaxID=1034769 RepID=UPI00035CB104|nr:heme ABC transporter substrate-binding protein IsdE [Paenibacillus sp. HW567]